MKNSRKYNLLSEKEADVVSRMGVVPVRAGACFTEEAIEAALRRQRDFRLVSVSISKSKKEDSSVLAVIEYLNEEYSIFFYASPMPVVVQELEDYDFGNRIDRKELDHACKQPYFTGTAMLFGENPLVSFHLQLKAMNAVVPDACLVIDCNANKLLSAKWLKMTAQSQIPPSPDYLYTVHAVYNDEDGKTKYWLHTHGLQRCGLIELEILDITDGVQEMYDLISAVVKIFLENPAQEREKFQIGYDGLDISLSWLSWEKAVKDLPAETLGGKDDRDGDDNPHAEPSGVLFAVEEGELVSPRIYASTLSNNPIYYISNEETRRMSDLAKERFPFFMDVYEKYRDGNKKPKRRKPSSNKSDTDLSWLFLVKLGLLVDGAENGTEKEHLWFEVLSLEGEMLEGKLLNQPYWISSLHEGDVRKYPLELLTDWIIDSPEGYSYTTDSIYQLGYS